MELLQGHPVTLQEVSEANRGLLHTLELDGKTLDIYKASGRGCYFFVLTIDEDAAVYCRMVENSTAIRDWEPEENELKDFANSWFNELC